MEINDDFLLLLSLPFFAVAIALVITPLIRFVSWAVRFVESLLNVG